MPKRRTSISLGGGLLLALTLALSGCGGAADQESSDTASAGDSAQLRVADAAADGAPAPGCGGKAPEPFATLNPTGPTQPWSLVTAYLAQNPLASDSFSAPVRLCKGCAQIPATLRPLANTCAISSKTGETWLMGRVETTAPLSGANLSMFGLQNDSSRVYLVTKGKVVYAIYPKRVKVGSDSSAMVIAYVPGIKPNTPRWNFITCPDPAHGSAAAWGEYTPNDTTGIVCTPLKAAGDLTVQNADGDSAAQVGEPGEELAYAWMACINGCCRFYGPQPPYTGGDDDENVVGPPPGGGQPGGGQPGGGQPGGGRPKGQGGTR